MNASSDKVRVATFGRWDRLWLVHAGYSGTPWPVCAARLVRRFIGGAKLENPTRPGRKGPERAGHRALLATELEETNRRMLALDAELRGRKQPQQSPASTPVEFERPRAVTHGFWWLVVFALFLLLGDAIFIYLAIADYCGLDVAGNGEASTITLLYVGAGTLVIVLVNAWLGSKATVEAPPVTKLWGRLGLLVLAIAVGFLRMSASPDDSFWFTIVGFMMTLSGGLAAGSAHHRVSEELHRRGEERLREQSLAKVQADTAVGASKLESELRDLESRRRALTAELDSLDQEPEKRATDEEELRRIKESHLADGAYYYNLGANFAGRPPVVEKVVDNA